MMIIGSILALLIALFTIAIGWRGRLIERGVFCKSCSFDLQGIMITDSGSRCPECGTDVHDQSARRNARRQVARVWIIAGGMLAMMGLGGMYVAIFVTNTTIYTHLPSPIVLSLAEQGYSDAIDEAIARWMKPGELSHDQHAHLIQHTLDIQADTTLNWDPRWGELLRIAIQSRQLTNDQLIAFVLNGYTYRVALPEKIRQGEDQVAWTLITDADRVRSTWGGVLPYKLGVKITSWGVEGESPIAEFEPPRYTPALVLQGPEPNRDWVRSYFRGAHQFTNAPAGTEIEIFVEYRVRLLDPDQSEPIMDRVFRQGHTIKIVGEQDEIVTRNRDALVAGQVLEALSLTPMYIADDLKLGENKHQLVIAQTTMHTRELPVPIAMRVTIRIDDEEIELDRFSVKTQEGSGVGELLTWRIMPPDQSAIDAAKPYYARLLDAVQVDVVMRPDSEFARENPEITEIADVALIFRDVPVLIQGEKDWYDDPHIDQATLKGEILVAP